VYVCAPEHSVSQGETSAGCSRGSDGSPNRHADCDKSALGYRDGLSAKKFLAAESVARIIVSPVAAVYDRRSYQMKAGFVEKLIGRLGKIDAGEVQNYFLRLAQEKGFLETVFNAIQEGIIVTDATGRITYLNEAACDLFGLENHDAIGKRLDERVRGLDWEGLSRSRGPITRDMEIFYPANRFINFYIVPLIIERREDRIVGDGEEKGSEHVALDDHPEQVGYAIILRDITETRRSTQQTIESERLNALTLLAAGVAHEIGNPLNSLHIHLQLMERKVRELSGPAKTELQESINVARAEIRRLDSIVTQFLRAIRPAKPQLLAENINAIVDEAVQFFGPEIKDRDMVVEQELRSDLPLVQVDRDQMKQAFYNVIKNSLEAMKRRGILRIRTDMDATHVIVSFKDTGGGISADNLGRVFEPYFTTKTSGSGLGLMIVRRIVREHGGELGIESSEGKGVTITIRIPFRDQRVRMLEAGTPKTK
jgi:signal transduction histidine kinase